MRVPGRTIPIDVGHGCVSQCSTCSDCRSKGAYSLWPVCFFMWQKKDRHSSPVGRSPVALFCGQKFETGPLTSPRAKASADYEISFGHPEDFCNSYRPLADSRAAASNASRSPRGADEERLRHRQRPSAFASSGVRCDDLAHILLKEDPKALEAGEIDNKELRRSNFGCLRGGE